MLEGKKTYVVAGLMALANFVLQAGFISQEIYQAFLGFLTAAGFATLRAGVSKANHKPGSGLEGEK